MRVGHDVPLRPSPDREILPDPAEHAVRIHDRLGLQVGRQLALRRFGGVLGRTPSELLGLDWPAYRRIVFGVRRRGISPYPLGDGQVNICPIARVNNG